MRRYSPATSSLSSCCCEHAGPLRHVHGFPGLGLLRVLRPIPTASADDGPSHPSTLAGQRGGTTGWFPRSLSNRSTGSAPSYAPATSPRLRRRPSPWPPGRRHRPDQRVPHPTRPCGCALQPSPDPPGSSWWCLLRGVQPLVPHVHLSVSLAGPGPSGSAGPSRRCQGCFHPPPRPRDQAALSFNAPAATSTWRCPFTTARFEERLVALDVGDPQPVRCRRR